MGGVLSTKPVNPSQTEAGFWVRAVEYGFVFLPISRGSEHWDLWQIRKIGPDLVQRHGCSLCAEGIRRNAICL